MKTFHLFFFRFLNLFYCQNSAFPEEIFWSLMEKIGTALCSVIFIMDKKVKLRISIKFSVSNRNMCSESLKVLQKIYGESCMFLNMNSLRQMNDLRHLKRTKKW